MGFYDREYYREERPGLTLRAPRTIVSALIVINVAVWLIDGLLIPQPHWLSNQMAVHVNIPQRVGITPDGETVVVRSIDTPTQPWLWWQYLTYAFAHAPGLNHVLCNMLALFFLGYDVEAAYGRKEFWRLYLAMAIFAGVVFSIIGKMSHSHDIMYGASGAITGVVMLYALNFPRRMLLLFFVIPIPAWLVGVLLVVQNLWGAMSAGQDNNAGPNVAYTVHLAGAAFALIYYNQRWNLTRWTNVFSTFARSRRRPKLRVHQPPVEERRAEKSRVDEQRVEKQHDEPAGDLGAEVDRILEKIYREGEASLTTKERRTLETASRQYQRRGRPGGQ